MIVSELFGELYENELTGYTILTDQLFNRFSCRTRSREKIHDDITRGRWRKS